MNHKRTLFLLASVLSFFLLSSCSASSDGSSLEEVESETTQTTTSIVVEESTTTTSTATSLPPESTTVAAAPIVLMPNVVCMNLQAAQDEIQKYGVFFSRISDATGMNRMQLFDRNWVVIKQSPKAGQPVTELEAVLSVVKIGESTGGVC